MNRTISCFTAEYFANSYNAFCLFVSDIFIFYGRRKAFLRPWHDSFTIVEKHFYIRKNKF